MADLEGAAFGIWPDNLPAVNAYIAMLTQWRTGGGMDYTALPVVLRIHRVPRTEWDDLFECLRTMEAEAISLREMQ